MFSQLLDKMTRARASMTLLRRISFKVWVHGRNWDLIS